MRGQPFAFGIVRGDARIIPARAGPTRWFKPSRRRRPDHPRSCGANHVVIGFHDVLCGSSPLVRGQPATDNVAAGDVRIIPARAGPTYITVDFDRASTDHPRSCGANVLSRLRWRGHFGSSPLVRGQLVLQLQRQRHARIIPARAGPTFLRGCKYPIYADHPRSCGANPVSFDVIPVSQRIIPARAGANCACRVISTKRHGSSPLVRGQPVIFPPLSVRARIIPARAGPTPFAISVASSVADHPRSCGANLMFSSAFFISSGSSPLVRGQLLF